MTMTGHTVGELQQIIEQTKTIEAFPQGERMVGILLKAGFSEASFRRLTFGICTMYFAIK